MRYNGNITRNTDNDTNFWIWMGTFENNPPETRILGVDFSDLSPNSGDIKWTDLMSTSFFHEDFLVTNLKKFSEF